MTLVFGLGARSFVGQLANSVTQLGATFTFASPRIVGQYANGDWWVLGPVSITETSPAYALYDGTYEDGTPYTGRAINGSMVNPGNRSFATGGLAANNANGTSLGYDGLAPQVGGGPDAPYNAAFNVDPGKTGAPLFVTEGTVVKAISNLDGDVIGSRRLLSDLVALTVVSETPDLLAIRPGIAGSDKASRFTVNDFDLSVFQNYTPPSGAPTAAEALAAVAQVFETSQTGNATSRNNMPSYYPEYGRDIARGNINKALLGLHLNWTDAEKRAVMACLGALAEDLVSRVDEGGIFEGDGGGNNWHKATIAIAAASLGANAPDNMLEYLDAAQGEKFSEDRQIFRVSGLDVALPRDVSDGRPRSAYTNEMLGTAEWGFQAAIQPQLNGSNWDAFYRNIVGVHSIGSALAVELTTGAKALWNNQDYFVYQDSAWHRRGEWTLSPNSVTAFDEAFITAHRPAKVAVPALVEAGIKDDGVYLRYDQALNETATPPATSDFAVNVNGSPVTVSSVTVFRQNLGLGLAAAVAGNDAVTVSYTAGTNPARSVDGVNVANLTAQALTNTSDKVGGPNAAYPVVRFAPGVSRTIGGTNTLAAANGQQGTIALLKFKFDAAPAADVTIFGRAAGGSPPFRLILSTTGRLLFRFVNSTGTNVAQSLTPVLTPGQSYDLLFSIDMTQATATAAINCYDGDTALSMTHVSFTSGGTIGWARAEPGQGWNTGTGTDFELGAFWLDATARLDLTNSANRALFNSVTSGDLDILTLGDGITGIQPAQFHVGDADQWNAGGGINRGSGNKFFVTSGALTLVSGSEWI